MIVVDYGCPDGTEAWVKQNFPEVKVVKVEDDPGFSISRARNLGGNHRHINGFALLMPI